MMTTQQLVLAETVSGLKKALKRRAYESDSDESVDRRGNRGNKLKKRARFAQKGQLAPPSGPEVYKETVEYGGVRRDIICRNPKLVDDDGYDVETDDDDERVQDAMASAAELHPYANVRLEHVLAPLTATTDLPTHPTLSRPFTSKMLTQLAEQSSEIMRKENRALWRVKRLLAGLCGDFPWAPCGLMLGDDSIDVYSDDFITQQLARATKAAAPAADSDSSGTMNGESKSDKNRTDGTGSADGAPPEATPTDGGDENGDVSMVDADNLAQDKRAAETKGDKVAAENGKNGGSKPAEASGPTNGDSTTPLPENEQQNSKPSELSDSRPEANGKHGDESHKDQRTGDVAEQNGVVGASLMTEGLEKLLIHPLFQPPPNSTPDVGLPENEADTVRRLVLLYVQKQEEICRGTRRLNEGLLRAERLRKQVLQWAKSEAHCGPNRDMSDGEDWYDKEEWGLAEDLKKGQDEEEEDTGTTSKKTRTRR